MRSSFITGKKSKLIYAAEKMGIIPHANKFKLGKEFSDLKQESETATHLEMRNMAKFIWRGFLCGTMSEQGVSYRGHWSIVEGRRCSHGLYSLSC